MSARIWPMPSLTSSADCALTKRPRPLTAACQRSSTPELSGWKTVGYGFGHCKAPEESCDSVVDWLPAGSLPDVPSDIAAKFWCCQLAGSLVGDVGTLFTPCAPLVRKSVTQ